MPDCSQDLIRIDCMHLQSCHKVIDVINTEDSHVGVIGLFNITLLVDGFASRLNMCIPIVRSTFTNPFRCAQPSALSHAWKSLSIPRISGSALHSSRQDTNSALPFIAAKIKLSIFGHSFVRQYFQD